MTKTSMVTKTQELHLDFLKLVSDSRAITEFHTRVAHATLYTTNVKQSIHRRKEKMFTSNYDSKTN